MIHHLPVLNFEPDAPLGRGYETAVLSPDHPLVLGSRSPRRAELLQSAAIPFVAIAADVDESVAGGERWDTYVERVVESKLEAAEVFLRARPECLAVLVADTVVVVDEAILGKPVDSADSAAMIRRLAGRSHEVSTGFAVRTRDGRVQRKTVTTIVEVDPLGPDDVARYVGTGEGLDKAGAYAIQGGFAFAVRSIRGSYSNVVGLPLAEVVESLRLLALLTR
jgi:septum formation protein